MATYQFIETQTHGYRAEIQLNRPQSLNALNSRMLDELADILNRVGKDDSVRTVVLSGRGRGFSSGQDLKEITTQSDNLDMGQHLDDHYHPVIYALRRMPKPVIAKIQGIAAGAGMSLALACDLRIGSEQAQFSQAFVKLGLVPDCGSTYFLPRLIGLGKAMELAMLGDVISAQQAYNVGILNQLVTKDRLDEATIMLADRLHSLPPIALGMIKQALNMSQDNDLDHQLHLERDLQRQAGFTQDYHIGLEALMHRQTPHFTGQ